MARKDKPAPAGHNAVSADQVRQYVERINKLVDERTSINDDIKEVVAEAKGNGFDGPMIRHAARVARMEASERQEKLALRDLYEGCVVADLV